MILGDFLEALMILCQSAEIARESWLLTEEKEGRGKKLIKKKKVSSTRNCVGKLKNRK